MKRRQFSFHFSLPQPELRFDWRAWLPSRGNVLFTFVVITLLLWTQSAGAVPFRVEDAASTGTIAYQGRLANSNGDPLTKQLNMSFRLYNAFTGSAPLWTEQWTGSSGVQVSDGLFNVMLGSLTPIPQSVITGNSTLFLGITVDTDDEMVPRVQLGSTPFAVQALTVPNGSISSAKIANGAVTMSKLGADVSLVPPDGSVTTAKIADGAVTQQKAPSLLKSANGNNQIIRSGNDVFPSGTDANGVIKISYECFPNGVHTFLALNGHWDANHSQVVANNGGGRCSTDIVVSPPNSNAIRINWIAIGN